MAPARSPNQWHRSRHRANRWHRTNRRHRANRCHCGNRRHRANQWHCSNRRHRANRWQHRHHRANLQLHWQHRHRANLQLHCRHRANLQLHTGTEPTCSYIAGNLQLQLQHRHRANQQQLHCRANLQLPQTEPTSATVSGNTGIASTCRYNSTSSGRARAHCTGVDVDALMQLLQVAKQVQSEDPAASKPAPVPVAPNQSAAAVLPGAPQHPPSPLADKHLPPPASETAQAMAAPGMPPGPATVAPPGVVPVIPKKINSNTHPREFAEYRRFCCNDPCAKEMSAVWQNLT